MSEWAKSRLIALVGGALFVFIVLVPLLGNRSIQLPAVIGGGVVPLRWVAFLALLPAISLAQSMEPRKRLQELAPPRRLAPWDGGLVLAVVAVMLATLAIADSTLSPIPGVAFRNSILIPLLTVLFAMRLSAPAAAGLTTAFILVSQSYAPSAPHAAWVRIFQPEGHPGLSILITLAVALTLGSVLARADRP